MRTKQILSKTRVVCATLVIGCAAQVAPAADGELPANHPPVPAAEQPAAVTGGGGTGTVFIEGGTVKADEATFETGGVLSVVGDGVVNFTATQPGGLSRAAYLGITTSAPDTALQKQLQLKAGVGLVVDTVEPGSPAEQAGVRQYDVLHKLDDQLLINTDQLGVLVRGYDPGKEVTLTLIREGKPQTLTAKLTERALPPLRLMLQPSGAAYPPAPTTVAGTVAIREAPRFNDFLVARGGAVGGVALQTPDGKSQVSAAQVMIDDGKHKMTITSPGGHKHMKVQDKSGKVIFDGPIDTKEDVEKVPAEVRKLYQMILHNYALPKAAATEAESDASPLTPGRAAPAPAPTPTAPAPVPTPQR